MINQQILGEGRVEEIKRRQLIALIRRYGPVAELKVIRQLQIGVAGRDIILFLPAFANAFASGSKQRIIQFSVAVKNPTRQLEYLLRPTWRQIP